MWCCYYEGNARSKKVQEKLGFTYVRTDPKGDTLLGYTLPEIENVLRKADFDDKSLLIKSQVLFQKIQWRKWRHNKETVLKGGHA